MELQNSLCTFAPQGCAQGRVKERRRASAMEGAFHGFSGGERLSYSHYSHMLEPFAEVSAELREAHQNAV